MWDRGKEVGCQPACRVKSLPRATRSSRSNACSRTLGGKSDTCLSITASAIKSAALPLPLTRREGMFCCTAASTVPTEPGPPWTHTLTRGTSSEFSSASWRVSPRVSTRPARSSAGFRFPACLSTDIHQMSMSERAAAPRSTEKRVLSHQRTHHTSKPFLKT
jgi:hypothetical protein